MTETQEGLSSLEALGIAIRAETDCRDMYREMAGRCEQPLLQRRFELLATEEEQHRTFLTDRWAQVSSGVDLKLPPSCLPADMCTGEQRKTRSMEEVLEVAIQQKRRSRDFYLRAARETADLSGQRMFQYLADMAYRQMVELTDERDLMIRYPRYHGPSSEPWQPERALEARRKV